MLISVMTSQQFKNAITALATSKMPVKTTFKLKKLIPLIEGEIKIFEETKNEIVKEYGQKDEKGELVVKDNLVNLDQARAAEWQQKIQELSALECSFELPKFTLDELGEDLKISAEELLVLGELISE